MEKKDLLKRKLDTKLTLEINFKGQEFENFIEINTLNKKLNAIDKTIKNTIKVLKETRQIKEKKEIIESIQIDLKRNSIDNIILIHFLAPTISGVIGGLLLKYFDYLSDRKKFNGDEKEIKILNKNIGNLNHILNLIEVKEINSKIEIKFENNIFNISNKENLQIKKSIKEIKEELEFQEYEESFLGTIEKLDYSKGDYFFTIDRSDKKVPVTFEKFLEKEELKIILLEKIFVDVISKYKGEELINIHVLNYRIIEKKTIKDFK